MRITEFIERMPERLRKSLENNESLRALFDQGADLHDALGSPDCLRRTYQMLTASEKTVLREALVSFGRSSFTEDELESLCRGKLSGAGVSLGIAGLRRKGIIFALRKTWGEQLLAIPYDTFAIWQQLLTPDIEESLKAIAAQNASPEIIYPSKAGLLHDMFRLLAYIAHRGLAVTQKGILRKNQLAALTDSLSLSAQDLSAVDLKFAHQNAYSEPFAVVYDMLLRLGLVEQRTDAVHLRTNRLSEWFRLPREEASVVVYGEWTRTCYPSPVWLQHAASSLERIPVGVWYDVEGVLYRLSICEMISAGETVQARHRFMTEWLKPLAGLGFADIGQTEEGRIAFRWVVPVTRSHTEKRGKDIASEPFIITPDYELIIPPNVDFSALWEIECMAEHVKTDVVHRYRINKESLHRAAYAGRTEHDIIRFLTKEAKYGIPGNVAEAISHWVGKANAVQLTDVTLLRCKDEAMADQIDRDPECALLIEARIGKLDFVVHSGEVKTLSRLLERHGLSPMNRQESEHQSGLSCPRIWSEAAHPADSRSFSQPAALEQTTGGIIYSPESLQYYKLEEQLPGPDQLFPGLERIPSLWLKEFRSYHSSTRRELIEQAIAWKAAIQLKMNGEMFHFTPLRIYESSSQWQVEGLSADVEISLSPAEWEEMQLILPGINDK